MSIVNRKELSMFCFQRLCSLVGRGIAMGALCAAMAGTSHAANIYLAFGFEPTSVTGVGASIVAGSLPTSFTPANATAANGASAVNGAIQYSIIAKPGSVITMNVVALISSNDATHANDGITGGFFSMDSLPSVSNLLGNYSVPVLNPGLAGTGSSPGVLADTDADTDSDVGFNHSPTGTTTIPGVSFAVATAGGTTPYFPDPNNLQTFTGFTKAILGTVQWTVGGAALPGQFTNLELFPFVSTQREFAYTSDGTNNANVGGTPLAAFGSENVNGATLNRLKWLNAGKVPTGTTAAATLIDTSPGVLVTIAAVPEPGTIALLGLGMVGIVACVRRRRA